MRSDMKTLIVLLATSLLLMGCVPKQIEPVKFRGPNGGTAYNMKCSGFGRTMDMCYAKSSEICPNGYEVIDISSGTISIPSVATKGGVIIVNKRDMAIECK
jgi:hypothetical protein